MFFDSVEFQVDLVKLNQFIFNHAKIGRELL